MRKNTTARLRSADSQTKRFGVEMLTPTMIILIIMTAYPLIFTLIYSFTDYNYLKGTDKASFVLFKNYIKLFKNDYFRQAVLNTIKFTILAVILEMGLGLLVAVFINSLKRGQKIMRTLLLLPYLLPAVTVALSWRMMLSSNYGIINQFLESLGLPWYNWFLDTKTAFGTILVIDVWQNTPFVFLLLFASLQSVPEGQYEAARIDGAGTFQQFWYVTIPNIKNSLALCALLRTIDTFRLFEKVNVLTGGGPAGTTSTITPVSYTHLQLRYQVPGLRLRQRGRHRDDRSGPAAFQCVHQTCDFVNAYGREEVNSYFCKCGLRRGHSSGKPGSLQA